MRLLLVDNDSDTLIELHGLCSRAGYDVDTVHCTALVNHTIENYDLIVLSGGYWYDNAQTQSLTYAQELSLIRDTKTPLLGICLGMQLMHCAFRGVVPLLDTPQSGLSKISLTKHGQEILALPETIETYKNHTRGIITAEPNFEVLGLSPGHLEIIRHQSLPMVGVQFHPEIGEQQESLDLFKKLVSACLR